MRYIRHYLALRRRQSTATFPMDPDQLVSLCQLIQLKKQHFASLMGIRRLTYHLRSQYHIWFSHRNVHHALTLVDLAGLELRGKHKLQRRIFHSQGPNQCWSLDGHDKLSHWGFPIHGCLDVYSRYVLWLQVGKSNNDPRYVLAYYLDAIEETARTRPSHECTLSYLYLRANL
jgi:hypothetical protein